MGCSTFSNFIVLPEIAVAKIRDDAPFDKSCYIADGVTTGFGAVVNTPRSRRAQRGGVRLWRDRAQRHSGARWWAPTRSSASTSRFQGGMGPPLWHDPFRHPSKVGGDIVAASVGLTDGGADYTFDCPAIPP